MSKFRGALKAAKAFRDRYTHELPTGPHTDVRKRKLNPSVLDKSIESGRTKERKRKSKVMGMGVKNVLKRMVGQKEGGRIGKQHGGRAGFKHGDWVQAPTPHADIKKYVDRGTGKEDTRGKRVRKEGSTMEFKKPRRSTGPLAGRQARKKLQHGGRTNLLEELGRVEAEPSNRNRRAEISRVHRELNKGYKGGKRVGLKGGNRPRPQGPHMWVRGQMAKASDKAIKGNKLTRKA